MNNLETFFCVSRLPATRGMNYNNLGQFVHFTSIEIKKETDYMG